MNAEDPPADKAVARSNIAIANRLQVLLFALLTIVLSVATVWGGRLWLKNYETLTFSVGPLNSEEARFATKLAELLKNSSSRLRLKIISSPSNTKALARFDRREADLAVLRTDAKIPPRARALAILDRDLLLLMTPGNKKLKSLAELKKRKIAILADGDNNVAFVRNFFDDPDASRTQVVPAGSALDKLFSSGFGVVAVVAHASSFTKDKSYERAAKHSGFVLNPIEEAKALAHKIPGVSEETVPAGMLSSSPEIPDDDVDTIGLEWLLVAQSRMSATAAGDLARLIYENKAQLAPNDGFASRIEAAETEKNAFIMAHQGAADYINDDTKSFIDRYSDVMYLGAGALSVIGSIFAAIYAKITRVAPEKASELATAILDVGERIEYAISLDALEKLQEELESILRGAVVGLRDGTISSDGLDTFKLGYEFVRDEINMRREYLKRRTGENAIQEDNVTVVKTARSA